MAEFQRYYSQDSPARRARGHCQCARAARVASVPRAIARTLRQPDCDTGQHTSPRAACPHRRRRPGPRPATDERPLRLRTTDNGAAVPEWADPNSGCRAVVRGAPAGQPRARSKQRLGAHRADQQLVAADCSRCRPPREGNSYSAPFTSVGSSHSSDTRARPWPPATHPGSGPGVSGVYRLLQSRSTGIAILNARVDCAAAVPCIRVRVADPPGHRPSLVSIASRARAASSARLPSPERYQRVVPWAATGAASQPARSHM